MTEAGRAEEVAPRTFDPFKFASPEQRRRYSSLAKRAAINYQASCKLHCLECCGWHYRTAKTCTANHCSLWAANQRIFK